MSTKLRVKGRFGIAPVKLLNDSNLSAKAKGIYVYIQSKPDGWDFSAQRIALDFKDGGGSVNSGLRELVKAGYLERNKYKNKKGQWEWEYVLYEIPFDGLPYIENPHMENPHMDIPYVGNKQINSKKDLSKKDYSKKEVDEDQKENSSTSGLNLMLKDKHGNTLAEIICSTMGNDYLEQIISKKKTIDTFFKTVEARGLKSFLDWTNYVAKNDLEMEHLQNQLKIKPDRIKKDLKDFYAYHKGQSKLYTKKDFRSHFINWKRKQ